MTEAQHNIFNAPAPGATSGASTDATSTSLGLPSKPAQTSDHTMPDANSPDTRGQKRPRDEEEEEDSDEDVAMEEDSDDE